LFFKGVIVVKGIILAGGMGTRLFPLTKVTNKHLLPVGKLPMINQVVKKFVDLNIDEIMIVTGTEHMGDIVSLLGSGSEYGCSFTYKVQDQPNGIAGALLLCENFVGNDPVLVILGDNIFEDNLKNLITKFKQIKHSRKDVPTCTLMLKEVEDCKHFGVATINKAGEIIKIIEKPKIPETNLCVTGVYLYDKHVFEFIKQCEVSARGEYEITDVNVKYIKLRGATYIIADGWWTDAGTHESYQTANRLASGLLE